MPPGHKLDRPAKLTLGTGTTANMTDFNDNDYEFFGMLDRLANVADTLVQSGGSIDREDFQFDDDDWRLFINNQWIVNAWIEEIRAHYRLYNWSIDVEWYRSERQVRFTCEWYAPDMEVMDAEAWWENQLTQLQHLQPSIREPATDEDIQMRPFDVSHSVCPVPPTPSTGVCG